MVTNQLSRQHELARNLRLSKKQKPFHCWKGYQRTLLTKYLEV